MKHGTNGYSNYQCRCEVCREAWRIFMANLRRRLRDRASQQVHGRRSTYINHGCRCQECRDAEAAYKRELRRRRAGPYEKQTGGTDG